MSVLKYLIIEMIVLKYKMDYQLQLYYYISQGIWCKKILHLINNNLGQNIFINIYSKKSTYSYNKIIWLWICRNIYVEKVNVYI